MTIEVPLGAGRVALIDDEDEQLIRGHRAWHLRLGARTAYAETTVYVRPGRTHSLLMHKLITGWAIVDHINGDGCDNRRANLRQATHAENARNRRRHANNRTGYKGVCPDGKRYRAQIYVNYRAIYLGMHATPEDAARAYDAAARDLHGKFARLNFPDGGQ